MKPRYSLRLFLIGTFVFGTIAAIVVERLSRVAPIPLHANAIGALSDDPAAPVEEPTLDEVRQLIQLERKNYGADFSGTVIELKILAVTTSIEPPRFVPLIGNACLHRAMFRCSVKLIKSDGTTFSEVVLLEKNAFRLMKDIL